MKGLKKVLSVFLIVVIMLTATPLSGFVGLELPEWLDFSIVSKAAEPISGTCGENLTWTFNESTGTLTILGSGDMMDYGAYTEIDNFCYAPWYGYRGKITTIKYDEGVTSICSRAFENCFSLKSVSVINSSNNGDSNNQVVIENNIKTIGEDAFRGCRSITKVVVGESVNYIGNRAFSGCRSLTNVSIGDNVSTMGYSVFAGCDSLKNVKIGSNLTKISDNTFYECELLTSIVIPDSVKIIEESAFYCCKSLASVVIGNSVEVIGGGAFYGCNSLTSIEIPDSVKHIYYDDFIYRGAFEYCHSLERVTIGDGVVSIGEEAFGGCEALTNITIGENVKTIACTFDDTAYYNDASNWENGALYIGDYLVATDKTIGESYEIKSGTKVIGGNAFLDNESLTNIIIPNSVIAIGKGTFSNTAYYNNASNWENDVLYIDNCLIKAKKSVDNDYKIKDGTRVIADGSFYECEFLTNVIIPDSVVTIGYESFYCCGELLSAQLGKNISTIGVSAFYSCNKLTNISIPDSVTTIGNYAFYGCTSLTSIIIPDGVTTIGEHTFYGCDAVVDVTIGNGVTTIYDSMFTYNHSLERVKIGDSVTTIGNFAFYDCTSLTSIIIPDGVTTIGDSAFSGCTSLTSITIPDSVTTIGEYAFTGCDSLLNFDVSTNNTVYSSKDGVLFNKDKTTLISYLVGNTRTSYTIPDGVKIIDNRAFCNDSLTYVIIPESVITIRCGAFGCSSLTNITVEENNMMYSSSDGVLFNKEKTTLVLYPDRNSRKSYNIPDSVILIADGAFGGCSVLEEIIIPDGVKTIGDSAFSGCTSLTSITIPDSINIIAPHSFTSCSSLLSVVLPDSIMLIGYGAFFMNNALSDVYYSGTQEQFSDITFDRYNTDLIRATIHFSGDTNISNNRIFSSKNDIVINTVETGVKCTIGSTVTENSSALKSFVLPYEDTAQEVVLSKNNYQNYIIPKAVIESWKAVEVEEISKNNNTPSYVHYSILNKDLSDNKPYVSTVFARNSDNAYLNAVQSEVKVYKDYDYEIIMSADNLDGRSCTYYIEQDATHKISSSTGVFSIEDLYNKLDFGITCYAYVKTSDGIISELVPVNFTKQPEDTQDKEMEFLKNSTFNILGNDFLSITIPEDVPLIGNAKISLNAFQLPAGVEIDGDSVKISIGANIYNLGTELKANSKTKYKKWSSECFKDWKALCEKTSSSDDEENNKNNKTALEKFKETWGNKKDKVSKSKDFDVNALGYIDGRIVNGKIVVKEACLNIGAEYSFKYTWQGAIWVVPAYVYAQMGGYVSGIANGTRVIVDSEIPFQWDLSLDFGPKLKVGGGAGVKDAVSAGIWANATVPFLINFTDNHFTIDLTGAIGVEAELFILKAEKTLFEGTMNLVDTYWGSSPKMTMYMNQQFGNVTTSAKSETKVSVIERDYLDNTSGWLSNGMLNFYGAAANGMTLTNLQTSVFNQASPQVVAFGDKMLMTWVEDDETRDTYNRMRLMYSIYENGVWSIPVPVYDDGKNDSTPVITTDGTDVYFAWQKIDEIITEDTATIDNLTVKTEIYTAKYDASTNEIVDAKCVSDNSCYDYAQSISMINGEPVCYWVSCADNQMSTSSQNTICRYEFGDSTTVVATDLNYILSITGTDVEGVENISYSMDVDGDTTTTDDVTVYTLVGDTATAFDKGDNEVAYTNVFYGDFNGEQTLFTSDMSNIYYVQDDEVKTVIDGNRAITGNFNYIIKNDTPTLFWTEKEEKGNAVYSSSYENDVWTTPVKVSDTGTQLSSVDVVAFNNQFRGVCTSSTLEFNDTKEIYEYVQTNLCSFIIGEVQDISVDGIYIDEENIKIGETTEFDVYVTNNGTETINEVSFEITDTLGFTSTVTKEVNLISGEGDFVTLSYTAPENYAKTTLTVTATCDEIIDNKVENNTAKKEIGKATLVLTESEVVETNGQYLITAMITNESDTTAENVVVNTLFNDSEQTIDTITIDSIAPRETHSIEYVVSAEELVFDEENDSTRVYITIDETKERYTGNKICFVLAKPTDLLCGHIFTEVINGYEPTCTTTGYEGDVKCTVCDEIIEQLAEIPTTEHTEDESICENLIEANCINEGSYDAVVYCSMCSVELKRETISIPATGLHTAGDWKITTEPTTESVGESVSECTICGYVIETKEIPILTETSGFCGNDLLWNYDIQTNTLTITGTGAMYDFSSNNRPWEDYEDEIREVVIDNSVTSIGKYAFAYYDNLASVTIGESVTTIGSSVFYNCTSLASVTIPDSVISIGDSAFGSSGIASIIIPDSVTSIGEGTFRYCGSLQSITVDNENQYYSTDEYGVLFNKDKTIIIQYPVGNTRTDYVIPDSVETIGVLSFAGCTNLTNVTIPDGVTTLEKNAFTQCNLTSIFIPDSVTSLGSSAFMWCNSLSDVVIGNGLVVIPDGAFFFCSSITNLTIGDGVTTIDECAFDGCSKLKDVYYSGTEEEWNAIEIREYNDSLLNATYHFLCENKVIFVDEDMHMEGLIYKLNSLCEVESRIDIDNFYIKAYDIDGVELTTDDLVGTGATIYIYDSETNELLNIYTVVLYGDVNGDGLINDFDKDIISSVASCQYKIENEWFLMAADTNHDGAVDAFDVIETELQYLDMHNIEQVNNSAYISNKEDETEEQLVT